MSAKVNEKENTQIEYTFRHSSLLFNILEASVIDRIYRVRFREYYIGQVVEELACQSDVKFKRLAHVDSFCKPTFRLTTEETIYLFFYRIDSIRRWGWCTIFTCSGSPRIIIIRVNKVLSQLKIYSQTVYANIQLITIGTQCEGQILEQGETNVTAALIKNNNNSAVFTTMTLNKQHGFENLQKTCIEIVQ